MVETVIAVLIVVFIFVILFDLAQLFLGKICAEHAAMRAARARATGMNDFMCKKAARVAMIPAAGQRLWPEHIGSWDESSGTDVSELEKGRISNYLIAKDEPTARGILEYEGWRTLSVRVDESDDRVKADVSLGVSLLCSTGLCVRVTGHAEIERHADLYLTKDN